jgi:hypothetical protein
MNVIFKYLLALVFIMMQFTWRGCFASILLKLVIFGAAYSAAVPKNGASEGRIDSVRFSG